MGLPTADIERLRQSIKARRLRGLAAVQEMLDMIGREGATDHDMADVFCVHETEVRALVEYAFDKMREDS